MILVGVDDDRTVVAYDRPHSVSDQIGNIIRNSVQESPLATVEEVIIRDRRVFGTIKPSAFEMKRHMLGGEVWLRAGATTFRASPAEVRRMLTPPPGPPTAVWA